MPLPAQAAYDQTAPNGSGRRALSDRTTLVFRLVRKQSPAQLVDVATASDPFLLQVQQGIRTVRNFVRGLNASLVPTGTPLVGRVVEKEFRFVLLLERFEQTPELRTSFTYLRNGFFIDTPFGKATGVTRFRLAGMTFWTPVSVNGVMVDGDSALKDFQELVEDYFYPTDGRQASDFELYMIDLRAPVSADDPIGAQEWLIHPVRNGVQVSQHARRPFLRQFQFDFLGLQSNRDLQKAEDGFLSSLFSKGFLAALLDKLGLTGIVDAIKGVFGVVNEFNGLLADVSSLVSSVNDYITGGVAFIQESFALVRRTLDGVQDLIGRVQEGINALRAVPDVFSDEWRRLQQGWPGLIGTEEGGSVDDQVEVGVIAADEARRLRDFLLALSAQPQTFADSIRTPHPPQTVAVRIEPGATIEQISRSADVDVATLIEANNLQWPFIDSRPRPERQVAAAEAQRDASQRALDAAIAVQAPEQVLRPLRVKVAEAEADIAAWRAQSPSEQGVLYAGDSVRLPQRRREGPPASILGTRDNFVALRHDAASEEERLFGIDLLLTDQGNLVWDEDQKDLVLTRGLANISAAQRKYVRLPLGALRFAPGIGNFAYEDVAKWQGPGSNQLLAYAIWRTLNQDPRIAKVVDVRAATDGGVAQLQYRAELINGQQLVDTRMPVGDGYAG